MSKLGSILLAREQYGKRAAVIKPLTITDSYDVGTIATNYAALYKIGATFELKAWITEEDKRSGVLESVTKRAKQHILHAVFGEFLAPLYEAQSAIDSGEYREANDLIQKVIEGFFSSEEVKA